MPALDPPAHPARPGADATPVPAPLALADQVSAAAEQGRVCALAAGGARDLQAVAAAYPELFPARPFDATLFGTVALATAFGAPWGTREQLRIANLTALWVFAVDWRIDTLAREAADVHGVVARCLAAADGPEPKPHTDGAEPKPHAHGPEPKPHADGAEPKQHDDGAEPKPHAHGPEPKQPADGPESEPRSGGPATTMPDDDPLARMLADVRDELAAAPAFAAHRAAWREELRRMLEAMRREWHWKSSGARPDLEAYLDNADNFGSSWVNVSHWLAGGEPDALAALPALTAAGRLVQRVLRLVNDLATHERDVAWGDLNALLLGAGRDEVTRRIGELAREALAAAEALTATSPREAAYLSRQIGFSTGFYRLTDFWGTR